MRVASTTSAGAPSSGSTDMTTSLAAGTIAFPRRTGPRPVEPEPSERRPLARPASEVARRIRERALLLWPGLDRTRLARTAGDPHRVARLVACRSSLPPEVIVAMLVAPLEQD